MSQIGNYQKVISDYGKTFVKVSCSCYLIHLLINDLFKDLIMLIQWLVLKLFHTYTIKIIYFNTYLKVNYHCYLLLQVWSLLPSFVNFPFELILHISIEKVTWTNIWIIIRMLNLCHGNKFSILNNSLNVESIFWR